MNSVYTTPTSVRLALVPSSAGALPNPASNTAADFSDAQLQDAIDEAAALIDSYIGKFYVTPVAQVDGATPQPIGFWARNIAAYNATLTYRNSMPVPPDDPVSLRWKATMDALGLVATGKVTLSIPENVGDSAANSVGRAINPYVGDLWTPDDFSLNPGYGGSPSFNGIW